MSRKDQVYIVPVSDNIELEGPFLKPTTSDESTEVDINPILREIKEATLLEGKNVLVCVLSVLDVRNSS